MEIASKLNKKAVLIALLSLTSCAGGNSASSEHTTHTYGAWIREEDRHYRVCTVCEEIQEGEHEGYICDVCAEFKVLALGYLSGGDPAHVDFAKEANVYLKEKGRELGYIYDSSTDFSLLDEDYLLDYQLVIFLNDLPHSQRQEEAFEYYMENGGSWLGCHVCAFTTDASSWSWYHENFLGSGAFYSNTWNPTKEMLRVETHNHFSTANLPDVFESSHNEWYSWSYDLTKNDDIDILLSLDESSYPVGDRTGEIWYEGYYPVAWTNHNYNMVYMNMGHNLQSYNDFEKESKTFSSEDECTFILDAIMGLGRACTY